MTINQRSKGAQGEREVRYELQQAVGNCHNIEFHRNPYDQARQKGHADIVCDDPRWMHHIEVKRRKSGKFRQDWMDQSVFGAKKHNQFPVVIYRFDRDQWQVVMRLGDLIKQYWGNDSDFDDLNTENVTIDLGTYFRIAKEVFSDVKRDPKRFAPSKCLQCDGKGEIEKIIEDPSGFPFEIDVMVPCEKCVGVGLC